MIQLNVGRDRYDPTFGKLIKRASILGMKLYRNCLSMGFVLEFSGGEKKKFKSFSSLIQFINEQQKTGSS